MSSDEICVRATGVWTHSWAGPEIQSMENVAQNIPIMEGVNGKTINTIDRNK